jgi:lysozyme
MLDLSNNNGSGHNFRQARAAGHARLYLKCTEGNGFADRLFGPLAEEARIAGFRVGAYHFAHPSSGSAGTEAAFFIAHARAHYERTSLLLNPCLDLEHGTPSASYGRWAADWIQIVSRALSARVIVYGSAWFLQACAFKSPPGALWLAAYGRDDGQEHPYSTPHPWRDVAAHQYADDALVPGIRGRCDVSRVRIPAALDLRRPR